MKKVIRLSESDLARIVKRVIKETEEGSEKESVCRSPKRTAQTVGNFADKKLVYDLNMIKPVDLQTKIKNAGSNTGYLDSVEGGAIKMWASRSWDWSNIGKSITSLPFGEKLGELKPGPKFQKLFNSDSPYYEVEWKYSNNKVTFYFSPIPEGC